jgi:hypothetical protein
MEPVPPRQARRRRLFEPEFKAEIVRLIVEGGRSYKQVAADFDLVVTCVRDWVRRAAIDAIGPAAAGIARTMQRGYSLHSAYPVCPCARSRLLQDREDTPPSSHLPEPNLRGYLHGTGVRQLDRRQSREDVYPLEAAVRKWDNDDLGRARYHTDAPGEGFNVSSPGSGLHPRVKSV